MSKNLVGCKHCIACSDIENQSYCIENVPYEKDDFLRIKDTYLATHIPQITHTENYISTSNSNKLSTHLNNALYAYNTHTAQNVCFVG
jgi:hypothetical protein